MCIIALIEGGNKSSYRGGLACTYTKGVSESYKGAYTEEGDVCPLKKILRGRGHVAEPLGSGSGPVAGVFLDVVDEEDTCVSRLPDAPCGEDDERG